jgi:hypothetical protein
MHGPISTFPQVFSRSLPQEGEGTNGGAGSF